MSRATNGLQVLYDFKEGSGNTVNDVSGSGTPMNLTIANTANVQWQAGQGLRTINTGTIIDAAGNATKIIDAVKVSNEITLEAWIEVDDPDVNGPARILTISVDGGARGATLGQNAFQSPATGNYFFTVRLNTSDPNVTNNGNPDFSTNETYLASVLHHVVYTRNASGVEQIYVDGVSVETGIRSGDFSSWTNNYKLALADENFHGGRNWFGTYYLAAVYSRALTSTEVQQNYNAGYGESPPVDPSALVANTVSTSEIGLTWQDNSTDETGFEIHRSLTAGSGFALITTTAANATTYTDNGLLSGTTYYYKVRAVNATGPSAFSNEAMATTQSTVRVVDQLQVLYNFREGSGNIVNDVSGSGTPMNLTIANTANVQWQAGQGLRTINTGTIIDAAGNATKIINAVRASNEITLEAWVEVDDPDANGPARILTISVDGGARGATLGQNAFQSPATGNYFFTVRLNTSDPNVTNNGNPDFSTNETYLASALHHVVYTRNASGVEQIYVDGVSVETGTRGGDFSSWANNYKLALADENFHGGRNWFGTYYLAAVYSKALTSTEVQQNYNAGYGEVPPADPSTLVATTVSDTEIGLTWQDNSTDETGFEIHRSLNATTGFSLLTTQAAGVVSYTDTGLNSATTYYYKVRAIKGGVNSGFTATTNATTNEGVPASPQNLVATTLSSTEINLTWLDISNNETEFIVERSFTSGSGYSQIGTVAANVVSFNDTGLTENQTAFYIVKAKNAIGESAPSNEAFATATSEIVMDGLGVYLNAADAASFDGSGNTWNDISGNSFGGTLGNTVSLDGAHLFFDGKIDQDGLSMPGVQVLAADRRFSIGFWMRPVSHQNWNQNLGGQNTWGSFWFHTNENGSVYTGITGDDINGRFTPADVPNGTVELYSWQYFTFTFSNGSAKLYKNGIELASKTLVNPTENWDGFKIEEGDGNFEQVHIYPNKELTAAAVMRNFKADERQFLEQRPYRDITRTLPGILEAEHFDEGGMGIAYNDLSINIRRGNIRRAERPYCVNDLLGGYYVGDVVNGEWLEYTVDVTPGLYNIDFNAAVDVTGPTTVTLSVDGQVAGTVSVTNTGGPTTFQDFLMPDIFIAAGTKVLRLAFDGSVNINKMNFDLIGTVPQTPANLGTATVSESQINLGWTDNSDDETSFEVYRSNSIDGPFTLLASVGSNVESYMDLTVTSENIYYYRVSAKNDIGESAFSNVAEANPDVITLPPPVPTNLTAVSLPDSEINLTWVNDATDERGFEIHRSFTAGSGFALIATTSPGTTTYVDTGLQGSTKYYYKVRAINVAGTSEFGNEVSATTRFISRVYEGLQVLYNFKEGSGSIVNDISNSGTPMNLTIGNTANVQWQAGQGLRTINGGTIIDAAGNATKIINAVRASNEITLETWVEVDDPDVNGPARILTISVDGGARGATLGQNAFQSPATGNYFFTVRLNTSDPNVTPNGNPDFSTNETYLASELHHVVYTRNVNGVEQIYVDGVSVETGTRGGDFSSWTNNYKLALADENFHGGRNWFGTYYLAAVYSRALTSTEVQQNFDAGFDIEGITGNFSFTLNTSKLPSPIPYDIQAYGLSGTFNSGASQVFDGPLTANPQSVLINIPAKEKADPYAIKFDVDNSGVISNFNVVNGIETALMNNAYFTLQANNEIELKPGRDVVITDPGFDVTLADGLMLTPDGDGLFDEFVVNGLDAVNNYLIIISNLRDTPIYQSTNKNVPWDGTDATTNVVPKGIYKYEITADGVTIKGQFIVDYN